MPSISCHWYFYRGCTIPWQEITLSHGIKLLYCLRRCSPMVNLLVLSLIYLLVISWFICSRRWCIDKLGVFHANQTYMCLDPHLNKGWGWRRETGLSPPVKYFTDRSKAYLLCFFWLVFAMPLCASVYMCLVVTCWERADLLALVYGVLLWDCHFPIGIMCQVWYLIVSIPDLCTLIYFAVFMSLLYHYVTLFPW